MASFLLIQSLVAQMPERVRYPHNIAHRGSSGYIPEHSLQAYQTAMDLQADYIEPDLCLTKDGILVAIHDILLDDVTDVAAKYPGRNKTKDVYGIITSGYFVSDFTLAEIKTLKLHQRLPYRSTIYDDLFTIPTLDEIMNLLQKEYKTNNITIGLYVEIKYPSYHNSLGFNMKMEDKLLQSLYMAGYNINGTGVYRNTKNVVPVIIQCFESASLVYLRPKTQVPIVQLVEINSSSTELSPTGMINALSKELVIEISQYADGIGPDKEFFTFMTIADGRSLVDLAHSLNLVIHPWTFRADSGILAWQDINNNFYKEQSFFFECLNIDGLFGEFPDMTKQVVDNLLSGEYVYPECHAASTSNEACEYSEGLVIGLIIGIVILSVLSVGLLGYIYMRIYKLHVPQRSSAESKNLPLAHLEAKNTK